MMNIINLNYNLDVGKKIFKNRIQNPAKILYFPLYNIYIYHEHGESIYLFVIRIQIDTGDFKSSCSTNITEDIIKHIFINIIIIFILIVLYT